MLYAILGFGVVVNFFMLFASMNRDPNGGMGMALFLVLAFVPYLFPIIFLVGKILEFTGIGQ